MCLKFDKTKRPQAKWLTKKHKFYKQADPRWRKEVYINDAMLQSVVSYKDKNEFEKMVSLSCFCLLSLRYYFWGIMWLF